MPPVTWALLAGNFVIGTGVMAVPGTLSDISASLKVPVAVAGQLISLAALLMAVGAPLCAAIVGTVDRRWLLTASLVWYGVLHLACALAPDFATLLPLRVVAMLAPAIFTPQAAACVGLLVPAAIRGQAITFIFIGWSVASVLGMPLAAYLGGVLGWQSAFALVGVLALASAAWLWRMMPAGVRLPALSMSAWARVFRSAPLTLCLAVTVLSAAGQFSVFSYFAPYFRQSMGMTAGELGLFFLWFGIFGFIGNALMSRYINRTGPDAAVQAGLVLMAASLAAFPLGTSLVLAALVSLPWALGCFSTNSAQQARLVALAPDLASGSIALNTSAMYAGQAIGAALGGWLIARGGMGDLHWAGAAGVLLALALSWQATRLGAGRRATSADRAPVE